jgi:hypothetical protein
MSARDRKVLELVAYAQLSPPKLPWRLASAPTPLGCAWPVFEIFPKVKQAIVRDDAIATGQALRALGFKVRWELIELNPDAGPDDPPTKQTRIVEPSPGMVVLSVLGPNGEGDSLDPFTDTLMVEVMTSREAREQLGH